MGYIVVQASGISLASLHMDFADVWELSIGGGGGLKSGWAWMGSLFSAQPSQPRAATVRDGAHRKRGELPDITCSAPPPKLN